MDYDLIVVKTLERVYKNYYYIIRGRIVLTHGFIKKTQRTPAGEIEKAKKYRRDYIERHGK